MKITSVSTVTIPDPELQDITACSPPGSCASLHLLRLDAVDPEISGNKPYKLRYNLQAAADGQYSRLVTFGGPYSNHLVAAAAAAARCRIAVTGIIRGADAAARPSPTLLRCAALGMRLVYVSREEYARKEQGESCSLLLSVERCFVMPEGGNNAEGRRGAAEIARFIPAWATHVCLPVGSGTTMAGLLSTVPSWRVLGFPALKDEEIARRISAHVATVTNWALNDQYTFGGFARTTDELLRFMQDFYLATGIPTDIVYTGKMMFGIADLLQKACFARNARIVAIHTGGLQGNPAGLLTPTAR